jgi:hypothetical protein
VIGLTMTSVSSSTDVDAMTKGKSPIVGTMRGMIDRLFERLERAQLRDVERTLRWASNSRELSQRVHRLEAGRSRLY